MKQLELNFPGYRELSVPEQAEIWGGGWLPVLWSIAASFVSNFGDFREGVSDGAHLTPPRY